MKRFTVKYLPSFEEELNERMEYVITKSQDIDTALRIVDAVENAILERSSCADSFEPILSRKNRKYPYYRIYVKEYIVYYVVYDIDDEHVMEIRNFRHRLEDRNKI